MLDWAGSAKMDESLLDELTEAGVQVERYHPMRWYSVARLNNRTHRKLLVIDGRIGFTGGVGIADQWRRPRAGSPALARPALSGRGPGGGAAAGGLHGQLDQDHRRAC